MMVVPSLPAQGLGSAFCPVFESIKAPSAYEALYKISLNKQTQERPTYLQAQFSDFVFVMMDKCAT